MIALTNRQARQFLLLLHGLLYRDRSLVDYPDKNLSILPAED